MNIIFFVGNITNEVKFQEVNNKFVVNFTLVNNKKVGDEEKAFFLECSKWTENKETAQKIADLLKKAKKVSAMGEPILKKAYNEQSKLGLFVNEFEVCSWKEEKKEETVKNDNENTDDLPY